MEEKELLITADQDGERADVLLARKVEDLSRSAAAKLLENGSVTRRGNPVGKSELMECGDVLAVTLPPPEPVEAVPEDIPLDIVYEDDDLIVVNKPVGMVVHPGPGHPNGTLVNALLYHCGDSLSGINGTLRPGIVHRIDRDTSGLLVAAKNDRAHQELARQLQDHTMHREYHAICVGGMREDSGTVDAPIGRHPVKRVCMAVDQRAGRPAVTHWQALERFSGYTYLLCRLETGRTHQIRVHLASLGHPLLGDPLYGTPVSWLAGQCLHAGRLCFNHPATGQPMDLECPLPDWFQETLERLRKREKK